MRRIGSSGGFVNDSPDSSAPEMPESLNVKATERFCPKYEYTIPFGGDFKFSAAIQLRYSARVKLVNHVTLLCAITTLRLSARVTHREREGGYSSRAIDIYGSVQLQSRIQLFTFFLRINLIKLFQMNYVISCLFAYRSLLPVSQILLVYPDTY